MFLFQMTDTRFNRCASFHPAPETPGGSTSSDLVNMNFDVSFVIVPTITSVNEYVERFFCDTVYLRKGVCQCVSVVGVSVYCHRANKPTTAAGCRNADFTAKFVTFVGFPFTDTLYFRGMDTVDFVLLISCPLVNSSGDIQ